MRMTHRVISLPRGNSVALAERSGLAQPAKMSGSVENNPFLKSQGRTNTTDLWALTPGNDGMAGSKGEIFFTSGVQGESAGLVGVIAPVPGHHDAFMVI
jgi:hypothetical protein